MAEGACLESMYTRKCIVGSNPTLSVIFDSWNFLLDFAKFRAGSKP